MKRKKLKAFLGQEITIIARFKVFGTSTTTKEKTICFTGVTSETLTPLSDHIWISGDQDFRIIKACGIKPGDIIKATALVSQYGHVGCPIRFGLTQLNNVTKIEDALVKRDYEILEETGLIESDREFIFNDIE